MQGICCLRVYSFKLIHIPVLIIEHNIEFISHVADYLVDVGRNAGNKGGETVESAVANALDAKKAWIEAALEDGVEIHEPDSLEDYSGQFKLRIPRSLHRSLAEHSQREGISMNQYCVYLLSRNDAVFSK